LGKKKAWKKLERKKKGQKKSQKAFGNKTQLEGRYGKIPKKANIELESPFVKPSGWKNHLRKGNHIPKREEAKRRKGGFKPRGCFRTQ